MFQLRQFEDPQKFDRAAGAWLRHNEFRHSLAISILATAIRTAKPIQGWVVEDSTGIRLVLLQTMRALLNVAGKDEAAADWAGRNVVADFSYVTGPAEEVSAFAKSWTATHNRHANLATAMTFYVLTKLEPFKTPDGGMRQATPDEIERIAELSLAAAKEMKLPEIEQRLDSVLERIGLSIREGREFVWSDAREIRAIARYAPALPDAGARIGNVYTLPEFRGRGYGAAITGHLTRLLLDSGQRWVSLFADDSNPTSTGIYRHLGYAPNHAAHSWHIE